MSQRQPGWLLREIEAQFADVIRGPEDMRAYQSELLIPFLLNTPKSGAFVDMGLGKTLCVLTMLAHQLERNLIGKALIIAPLRVAVKTWPTEIRLWRHTAWMSHSLIRADPHSPEVISAMRAARTRERKDVFGSPQYAAERAKSATMRLQRQRAARSPADIHIINREMVEWLVEFHGHDWPYDTVIIDESTSFADYRTVRWKALASRLSRIKRLHLLTGTPAPEGIIDLFAQVYLLDRGERLGRNITRFREAYMSHDPYKRRYTPLAHARDEITQKISDIVLVMKEEDYLDIAQPIIVERPVKLTPAEMKVYKRFEREFVLDVPDGQQIEALNSAALGQKLLQCASGAVYDENKAVHPIHNHKIEELREMVAENQGSPLLVAYWFRSSLERLRRAFPNAVVMDREAKCVDPWNAGKIDMLLIHPASAGHGLNMQLGPGHTLIFFDNPWPLELYLQIIKRIARQGQKRVVKVFHLVTEGTLDATIVPKLRAKEDAQDDVTAALKDLWQDYQDRKNTEVIS